MNIVTIAKKVDEEFLRKKIRPFDFVAHSRKEISQLITTMRRAMKEAKGIGLSANQIGLQVRVFVGQVENKFYAVFNPQLKQLSSESVTEDEGCLSVPGKYGATSRAERLILEGYDRNGKKIKIKAWGLLARMFQHEVDHLDGKLFIDKAEELHEVSNN